MLFILSYSDAKQFLIVTESLVPLTFTIRSFPFMNNSHSENDRISSNILSWAKATIGGREGDDTINGSDGNEVIYGGSGNDTIYAGSGNDTIYGQDGNDNINAGDGNDILDGGAGRDTLSGGAGNDRYIFKKGYGQDIIENYYYQHQRIYYLIRNQLFLNLLFYYLITSFQV